MTRLERIEKAAQVLVDTVFRYDGFETWQADPAALQALRAALSAPSALEATPHGGAIIKALALLLYAANDFAPEDDPDKYDPWRAAVVAGRSEYDELRRALASAPCPAHIRSRLTVPAPAAPEAPPRDDKYHRAIDAVRVVGAALATPSPAEGRAPTEVEVLGGSYETACAIYREVVAFAQEQYRVRAEINGGAEEYTYENGWCDALAGVLTILDVDVPPSAAPGAEGRAKEGDET